MKFVYFGYDFMLDAVQRLLSEGHELLGVFSFECDNIFNYNQKTQELARFLDIPFTTKKPEDIDISVFLEQGCTCFLSAGYLYKIPEIDPDAAYALNFHPSLLPKGRGLMPTPSIILEYPEASGITLHKMTQDYDAGDIVYQKALPLSANEDVETLSARIAMCAPDVFSAVFADLPRYWKEAKPQDEAAAVHFATPSEDMRRLNWADSVADLERKGRAFGRFGCVGSFDGKDWAIYNFKGWQEKHEFSAGSIVCVLSREVVLAVADGFIVVKEFQPIL